MKNVKTITNRPDRSVYNTQKMNFENDSRHLFRIVTLGDSSVGKTSIINRLVNKEFHGMEQPTVGATFLLHDEMVDGVKVEMQIWDTAGQEKYRSLSPIYCRNAAAAIIAFDITNHDSFSKLDEWCDLIERVSGNQTIVFFAANKSDLIEKNDVSEVEMNEYASRRNYPLINTSAKTGEGIEELFHQIAVEIVHRGFISVPNILPVQSSPKKETKECSC